MLISSAFSVVVVLVSLTFSVVVVVVVVMVVFVVVSVDVVLVVESPNGLAQSMCVSTSFRLTMSSRGVFTRRRKMKMMTKNS